MNINVEVVAHIINGEDSFDISYSAIFNNDDKFKSLLDVFIYAANHTVRNYNMKEKPEAGDSYFEVKTNSEEAYRFIKKNLKSLGKITLE